jgi:hypothetical protein
LLVNPRAAKWRLKPRYRHSQGPAEQGNLSYRSARQNRPQPCAAPSGAPETAHLTSFSANSTPTTTGLAIEILSTETLDNRQNCGILHLLFLSTSLLLFYFSLSIDVLKGPLSSGTMTRTPGSNSACGSCAGFLRCKHISRFQSKERHMAKTPRWFAFAALALVSFRGEHARDDTAIGHISPVYGVAIEFSANGQTEAVRGLERILAGRTVGPLYADPVTSTVAPNAIISSVAVCSLALCSDDTVCGYTKGNTDECDNDTDVAGCTEHSDCTDGTLCTLDGDCTGDATCTQTDGCTAGPQCTDSTHCTRGDKCTDNSACTAGDGCTGGTHCTRADHCTDGPSCTGGPSCTSSTFCTGDSSCTEGDYCTHGQGDNGCTNGTGCTASDYCTSGAKCTNSLACTFNYCTSGASCTGGDRCTKGNGCTGGNYCTSANLCTFGSDCTDGGSCTKDANANCTSGGRCSDGVGCPPTHSTCPTHTGCDG